MLAFTLSKISAPLYFLTLNTLVIFVLMTICLPLSSLSFYPAAWNADVMAGALGNLGPRGPQLFSRGSDAGRCKKPGSPGSLQIKIAILALEFNRTVALLTLLLLCSSPVLSNATYIITHPF